MHSIHLWELELIKALQTHRNDFLDTFFIGMNFLDTNPYYFLIIPIIWIGFDWKWGVRLLFLMFISQKICLDLKYLFAEPRPFLLDPSLALVKIENIYGLPSGAALVSSCFLGYLTLNWKTTSGWIFACTYVLLMCLSRVYLGVHFISDVVVGVLIGALLAYIGYRAIPRIEKWLYHQTWATIALISIFAPLMLLIPYITTASVQATTILIVSSLGLIMASKWELLLPTSTHWVRGIVRALIVTAGSFAILSLYTLLQGHFQQTHPLYPIVVRAALTALWLTLAAPLICRMVKVA